MQADVKWEISPLKPQHTNSATNELVLVPPSLGEKKFEPIVEIGTAEKKTLILSWSCGRGAVSSEQGEPPNPNVEPKLHRCALSAKHNCLLATELGAIGTADCAQSRVFASGGQKMATDVLPGYGWRGGERTRSRKIWHHCYQYGALD